MYNYYNNIKGYINMSIISEYNQKKDFIAQKRAQVAENMGLLDLAVTNGHLEDGVDYQHDVLSLKVEDARLSYASYVVTIEEYYVKLIEELEPLMNGANEEAVRVVCGRIGRHTVKLGKIREKMEEALENIDRYYRESSSYLKRNQYVPAEKNMQFTEDWLQFFAGTSFAMDTQIKMNINKLTEDVRKLLSKVSAPQELKDAIGLNEESNDLGDN